MDPGAPIEVVLDEWQGAAPAGLPSEWPVLRVGRAGGAPNEEVSRIISETVLSASMDEPPYLASLMLGASDLPWLRRFAELYAAEHRRISNSPSDADLHQQLEYLRSQGLRALAAVAARRVAENPDIQRRFGDPTLLRDIPEGSDEARWLSAMVELVDHSAIWVHTDLLPKEARRLLSAGDLPYLKRLCRQVFSIYEFVHAGWARERATEEVRRVARELSDYLAPRG